jgi:hypothetical protein
MQKASLSTSVVPAGGILLHIGVHKTGTTAIQAALANARPELGTYAVQYPGTRQAHRSIASSAMNRRLGWRTVGAPEPESEAWEEFLRESRSFSGVTVCSSEFFAESDDDTARSIVEAIGVDRVHVVLTLRNLGKILPSAWQQLLKSGYEVDYPDWLDNAFNAAEPELHAKSRNFWIRHRHDIVVRRWAELVGPERVTVVVVDDTDRTGIFSAFEQMLGIPAGKLAAFRDESNNRSMTVPEAQFLRALNIAVGGGKGWKPYSHTQHDGLIKAMTEGRSAPAEEKRIETPQWALDRAAELGHTYVEVIREIGVNVIGDLDVLETRLTGPAAIDYSGVDRLPIDVAVASVLGAMSTRQPRIEARASVLARAKRKLFRS